MPPAAEKLSTNCHLCTKELLYWQMQKDPQHRYAASRRKKSDSCSRWDEAMTKMQKIILGFCQRLNSCWVGCYHLYRGITTGSSPSKNITCEGINTKVSLRKRHLLQPADAIRIPRIMDITCDGISILEQSSSSIAICCLKNDHTRPHEFLHEKVQKIIHSNIPT